MEELTKSSVKEILLPPASQSNSPNSIQGARQITIIGANGAGKSRFMHEMIALAPGKAYQLSALSASFPEKEESSLPGSIDDLYNQAANRNTFMRTDAVSEIDKLTYMLFADELEALLDFKDQYEQFKNKVRYKPTKLDKIKKLWVYLFPGTKIIRNNSSLMFATLSGDDLISVEKLSQGEKTILYYAAAVLYAMPEAVIFIDSPSLFIHPSIIGKLWNAIERLRPDCTFVYNSVDMDFVNSRLGNTCIWIKSFDSARLRWDYQVFRNTPITEDLFVEIAGSRNPVLFIEGDARNSIDCKLYQLVFKDWMVRPLGSCNKVIETTRTFNDLKYMHQLKSRGIVDRDRRTDIEVEYLRNKEILVPDVAEVENFFLMEEIIQIMARRRGKNADKVLSRVKREVIKTFKQQADQQALQHVRHRVKREVECKIDAKFTCITALETHLKSLVYKLQPRKNFNALREEFSRMVIDNDYAAILRVFNYKPMLPNSGVAQLLGFHSKEDYIYGVLNVLKENSDDATAIRNTIKHCLHID